MFKNVINLLAALSNIKPLFGKWDAQYIYVN